MLDFLFSPWVEEEGDEVVALEVVVESSEIEVLVVSLVVGTEVESEFVISKGLVVLQKKVMGIITEFLLLCFCNQNRGGYHNVLIYLWHHQEFKVIEIIIALR